MGSSPTIATYLVRMTCVKESGMIKLNLLKIGKWGMLVFGAIFAICVILLLTVAPNTGEMALVWIIYLGTPAVIAKYGFFGALIVWIVGLVLNQKKPETETGS